MSTTALAEQPQQRQQRRRPQSRRRPAAATLLLLLLVALVALASSPTPTEAFTPALRKAAAGALKKAFGLGKQAQEQEATTTTTTTTKERAGPPTQPSFSATADISRATAQLIASALNPSAAVESWTAQLDARLQPSARAAGVAAAQLLALSAAESAAPGGSTVDDIASTLESLNRSLGMLLSAQGWRVDDGDDGAGEKAQQQQQQRAALDALRRYATAGVLRSAAAAERNIVDGVGSGWLDALVDGAVLRLELLRMGPGGAYGGGAAATTTTTPAERRLDDGLRAAVQRAQKRSSSGAYGSYDLAGGARKQQQQQQQVTAASAATARGTPPANPRQRELHALVSSAAMAVDPGPGASGPGAERLPERLAARRAWNARAARWLAGRWAAA
jgi:hypothetical protein